VVCYYVANFYYKVLNPLRQSTFTTLQPTLATDLITSSGLRHVAVIMDGNRRWAEAKNLPRLAGHAHGVNSLRQLVRYASDSGLQALTIYAFSTENWQRPPDEVNTLLQLLAQALNAELPDMHQQGICIRFLGDPTAFPPMLQQTMTQATQLTANNTGLCLQIAINYGSRVEIIRAVHRAAKQAQSEGCTLEDFYTHWLTQDQLSMYLDTAGLPDPDLLIRTGGESRLSNYMLWQCAYTELWVTDVLWPDFSQETLDQALTYYASRQRRYGR
jgi:undecaprenyl diphosphate synthase